MYIFVFEKHIIEYILLFTLDLLLGHNLTNQDCCPTPRPIPEGMTISFIHGVNKIEDFCMISFL